MVWLRNYGALIRHADLVGAYSRETYIPTETAEVLEFDTISVKLLLLLYVSVCL